MRRSTMSLSRRTFAVAALLLGVSSIVDGQAAKAKTKSKAHFTVTAPDLVSKGRITLTHVFNGMGCNGQNVSPAIQWANPPE